MGKLILKSDKIILQNDIFNGYIICENGIITKITAKKQQGYTDYTGYYISPGFIDMHTHGGGGYDFMDGVADDIIKACEMHLLHGTTTILPTTLACSNDELFGFIDNFKSSKKYLDGKMNLHGIHLEGPYFNSLQAGAQDPKYIKNPDESEYKKIVEYAGGEIKRWSVAPELDGAYEMGKYLSSLGIIVSAAHTNAEYCDIVRAVESGYTLLTHFYSGMSGLIRIGGYRHLGVIESGYLIDDLYIEIIADGHHLPPELLKLICKLKDNKKIALITDSMRAAGLPDGEYILGSIKNGQKVISEGGVAKLTDKSAFAGSIATADRLVRTMRDLAGLDICNAINMMAAVPAGILGIGTSKGAIKEGYDGDFAIFDEGVNIKNVFVGGTCVV